MPCDQCGTSHVSGICKQCELLNRMEDDLEAGAYPEGDARGEE